MAMRLGVLRRQALARADPRARPDHRSREVELPNIAWEAQEFDLACKKKLDTLAGLAYIARQPGFCGKEVCVWRKARQGNGRCRSDFPRNLWSGWRKRSGSCGKLRRRSSSRRLKNISSGTASKKSRRSPGSGPVHVGGCRRKGRLWSAIGVGGYSPSTEGERSRG